MSPGALGEYYQLVLAAVYHTDGLWGHATFDLYARALPEDWGFLVATGVGPLLDEIERLQFTDEDVAQLKADPVFAKVNPSFYDWLRRFRFSGEISAVPEGSVVFPGEPILRVTGPLMECTLIETKVIQTISQSTAVSSRAARLVEAAAGRPVLDFGSRRCAGGEAAMLAARAAYLGGVSATTNAAAVLHLGIPSMGTMSDTFLAAYGDDKLAHDAFRLHFPGLGHIAAPESHPLESIAQLARMAGDVQTLRIDHPDLARTSRLIRTALDAKKMKSVRILGSGQLDEHRIAELVADGAPIQLFAVGRHLGGLGDAGMRMAFRICERAKGPTLAAVTGAGAAPYPGRKQLVRFPTHDTLCLEHEAWPMSMAGGKSMLHPVWVEGRRVGGNPPLAELRAWRQQQVSALPAEVRALRKPATWSVQISDALAALAVRS